jgi:hypothetical protein
MKTILLIFLMLSASIAKSQDLILGMQLETTVAGSQSGVTIMYEAKKGFGIGGFYQRDIQPSRELKTLNTFYGGQIQAPLVKSERLMLSAVLRGGFVNQFVVVVPGLETQINIRKRLGVAIGSSLRMNYPAFSAKAVLKLF